MVARGERERVWEKWVNCFWLFFRLNKLNFKNKGKDLGACIPSKKKEIS